MATAKKAPAKKAAAKKAPAKKKSSRLQDRIDKTIIKLGAIIKGV